MNDVKVKQPIIWDAREREINWARNNGFSHRILKDNTGLKYVVGDWSWNMNHQISEDIEPRMRSQGIYDPTNTTSPPPLKGEGVKA